MRKINKNYHLVPQKLLHCFEKYQEQLFKEKENHNFQPNCYNHACMDELRNIYFDKCGYCERKLHFDESDKSKEASVDHFRPKKKYWWLGYEWSNLLLICTECNNKKGHSFSCRNRKVFTDIHHQIKQGSLDKCFFLCNSKELLREKPLLLNPEIDNPSDYFEFELDGKIIPKCKNSQDQERAIETINCTNLNRHGIQHKERKRKIDAILVDLNCSLYSLYKNHQDSNKWSKENLHAYFSPLFQKITILQGENEEFTLLANFIFTKFDLIIDEFISRNQYHADLKKVILFAWRQYLDQESS